MEEKIYDLLNDVKTDFSEYDNQMLSSDEARQIEKRLLQEVRKMKVNKRKQAYTKTRKSGKGIRAAVAAAAACAAVSLVVSSQTDAKGLLSSTFQKLIAGSEGSKYEKEEQELYTKIGKQSTQLTADTGKEVQKEGGKEAGKQKLTAKDAGVTMRASDVYCDGYMLYYTLVLETENPELTADGIDAIMTDVIKDRPHCNVKIAGQDDGMGLFVFRRQKDGTFISVQNYCFYGQTEPKTYQDGEIVPIAITIEQLVGVDFDNHREDGEYVYTEPASGEWKLSIPVKVETSGNRTQTINQEDNGVKLASVTKAKATLNLVLEEPNFTKEPYNDKYNDPDILIKDKNGNMLQWVGSYDDIQKDGSHVQSIALIDTGEEDYVLEVTNKNVDGKTIARIEFSVER